MHQQTALRGQPRSAPTERTATDSSRKSGECSSVVLSQPMIQSHSKKRGCGTTTLATPRVNIHVRRSSSTMSVPIREVNVQHITNTRTLSNRRCAISQPEKSCETTSITVFYLPTLSRRGCPHLVVRFPSIQIIRYATSTFVWLESHDMSTSLWHETAPQSCCRHGVPQRRRPNRGEGSSVSCYGEHDVLSRYCVDWMRYMA